jgi:hypothetical protein
MVDDLIKTLSENAPFGKPFSIPCKRYELLLEIDLVKTFCVMSSNITALFQASTYEMNSEESLIHKEQNRIKRLLAPGGCRKPRSSRPNVPNIQLCAEITSENSRSGYQSLWDAHENDWSIFCDSPPTLICFEAIPFPPCDGDVLEFTAHYKNLNKDMKRAYRLACRRFHPDKFLQKFGANIASGDEARIMARLTEITQAINGQYSKSLKRTFSEPPR